MELLRDNLVKKNILKKNIFKYLQLTYHYILNLYSNFYSICFTIIILKCIH